MKLMLKWPGLYYMTSAFAPKYYPKAIIDYANTRGADKVMYAGYYPMGLSLERIFARAARRAVPRPRVAEVPARERDARVQAGRPDGGTTHRVRRQRPRRAGDRRRRRGAARRRRPRCASASNVREFERAGRRAVRQAPRDHVQLGLVGALPRGRAARPRSRATRSSRRRVTFSTDIAPLVRAGLVPVFVDVEPDTYNIDVDGIEEMIGPTARRRSSRPTSSATRPTGTASARSPTATTCR